MIINSGIEEVVYNSKYPLSELSLSLLNEAGVKLRHLEVAEYKESEKKFEK